MLALELLPSEDAWLVPNGKATGNVRRAVGFRPITQVTVACRRPFPLLFPLVLQTVVFWNPGAYLNGGSPSNAVNMISGVPDGLSNTMLADEKHCRPVANGGK